MSVRILAAALLCPLVLQPALAEDAKPAVRECPAGKYTLQSPSGKGRCKPCPHPGSLTVRLEDGWNVCVGGEHACPAGSGIAGVLNAFRPTICVPCPKGWRAVPYSSTGTRPDGPLCVRKRCPAGKVPAPKAGPVTELGCYEPLEGADAAEGLEAAAAPRPPRCGSGKGLRYDPEREKWTCVRCASQNARVVRRYGRPVCGRYKGHSAKRDCPGKVRVRGKCRRCPSGTRLTRGRRGWKECVPARKKAGKRR